MSVCEVCGKAEEEEEASPGFLMETLHICPACREDRRSMAPGHPAGDSEEVRI